MTIYKVLIIGDGGVGKTAICFRATQNTFANDYKMTIGTAFFTYQREIDGDSVILQLWDFGGQERFRHFLDSFARGANGVMLAFDVSNVESFLGLDNSWVPFLQKNLSGVPVMFISTKSDLEAEVTDEMIKEYMEGSELNFVGYMPTSSMEGKNVHESFEELVRFLLKTSEGF